MAHALDITDGIAGFADSRNDAWHQLGQKVGHAMTADEVLTAAHLKNWNVRKVPLMAQVEDQTLAIDGKYAVIRNNPQRLLQIDTLGVVGERWTPFQNEATVDLLDEIVDRSGAHFETAGALRGGRETFVTMKLPENVTFTSPVNGAVDTTELYLALFNNHDGEGALRGVVTPVRVVCKNTQRMAEGAAKSRVSIRHTGDPRARLEEVRKLLGLAVNYTGEYERRMGRLAVVEMSDAEVLASFQTIVGATDAGTERQRNGRIEVASQMMELYRRSDTVASFKGTAFGAYNAVTEYADHFAALGRKGDAADLRAARTITGANDAVKTTAFSTLMALAN